MLEKITDRMLIPILGVAALFAAIIFVWAYGDNSGCLADAQESDDITASYCQPRLDAHATKVLETHTAFFEQYWYSENFATTYVLQDNMLEWFSQVDELVNHRIQDFESATAEALTAEALLPTATAENE